MTTRAGFLRRKLHRFRQFVAYPHRVIVSACLFGFGLVIVFATVSGSTFTATTVLRIANPVENAAFVSEAIQDIEVQIAKAMLGELDLLDERLPSVFARVPFKNDAPDPFETIQDRLTLYTVADSVTVQYRSSTAYEARHLSILASELLQSHFALDGSTSDSEFAATLGTLIDQREHLVDSLLSASSDNQGAVVAVALEVETLKQLRERLGRNAEPESMLDIVKEPAFPMQPDRRRALLFVLAATLGFGLLTQVLLRISKLVVPRIINPDDFDSRFDWHGSLSNFGASSSSGSDRLRLYLKPSVAADTKREDHPLADAVGFLLSQDRLTRTIVVGGPERSSGKTLVAFNLATLMSKVGLRVLLIDCDAQSGTLTGMFGRKASRGFLDVVWGDASLRETIHKSSNPSLDFLALGRSPYGLLPVRREVTAVLELLARTYDTVIVDEGAGSPASISENSDVYLSVFDQSSTSLKTAIRFSATRSHVGCQMFLMNDRSNLVGATSSSWVRSGRVPIRLLEDEPVESLKLVEKSPDTQVAGKLESLLSPYRRNPTPLTEEKAVS